MNLKVGTVMDVAATEPVGERKLMKRLAFVIVGMTALTLGACHSTNQDAVQNAELNQPSADELNQLSSDAANDAANSSATLGNQQNELNENAAAEENTTNPTDAQEQNVSGM